MKASKKSEQKMMEDDMERGMYLAYQKWAPIAGKDAARAAALEAVKRVEVKLNIMKRRTCK